MNVVPPNQPRVLVAEDNEALTRAISRILNTSFRFAGAVRDGQAAIQAVRDLKPDVVVLDILLPLLDGIQATRRLKTLKTKTKIVILTGLEDPHYINAALEAGARGFVFKRRMTTDLVEAINTVIAGGIYVSTV